MPLPVLGPQANLRSRNFFWIPDLTPSATLSIGELARRTGLSVSAVRFYEVRGLVRATRGPGNQRRFARSDIRRLSFALIAQQLGLSLTEIEAELSTLPQDGAPTRADWRAIGRRMRTASSRKKSPCCKERRSFWTAVLDAAAYRSIVAPFTTQTTALPALVLGRVFCWGTRHRTSRTIDRPRSVTGQLDHVRSTLWGKRWAAWSVIRYRLLTAHHVRIVAGLNQVFG